jgi:hypothetical protein
VALGMCEALHAASLLSGFTAVDTLNLEELRPSEDPVATALVVGDPATVEVVHMLDQPTKIWLLLAMNSLTMAPRLREYLERLLRNEKLHGIVVPSHTSLYVVANGLWNAMPQGRDIDIRKVRHGVSRAYSPYAWGPRQSGEIERIALHVTSSTHQRKGTRELILAWKRLEPRLRRQVRLRIICNPEAQLEYLYQAEDEPSIEVVLHDGCPTSQMARRIRRALVVVQPSRSEGFGLVPLQGLCMGVPAILTRRTGHREYAFGSAMESMCTNIALEATGPIDDFPGAEAPMLRVDAVHSALTETLPRLLREAEDPATLNAQHVFACDLWSHWSWGAIADRDRHALEHLAATDGG